MAVRAPWDSGYDPDTGWPPDDSTGIQWDGDTALPGQFKGGGAGFGPGGFQGSPKLTAPASGPPPGVSLSTTGGSQATVPDSVIPPVNSTIPNNNSVGPFTGGTATENGGTFDPRTSGAFRGPRWGGGPPPGFSWGGAAEEAAGAVGGSLLRRAGRMFNPLRRIPIVDIMTPTDELAGPAADEFNPNTQPVPRGVKPEDFPDQTPKYPTPMGYPPTGDFHQPDHPSTMRYPMWPTPPAPAPSAATPMPSRPVTPTPATAYPAPSAASPAAVRQQPNLGTYGAPPAAVANSPFTLVDRPNMSPQNSARGHQGAEQMGMLDLSHLFGGGQPAPAAAAPITARPDLAQRVPLSQTPLPPRRPARFKSSSSSQGGGY